MILRRFLFVAIVFLLLAPSVRAQEPADDEPDLKEALEKWERMTDEQKRRILEVYEERWKDLSEEEKRVRIEKYEDLLKGTTPQERRELAERLARLGRRTDLAELKRKQARMAAIVTRFEESLPEDVRAKLADLPDEKRQAVLTFAVARMAEVLRDQVVDQFPAHERDGMRRLPGHEFGKHWYTRLRERALARLTPEEQKTLEALPEIERRRRIAQLIREVREEDKAAAREAVAKEVAKLFELSKREMEERLRAPWIVGVLRGLGLEDDHDLARRLSQLTWPSLQGALARLREIQKIEDRGDRRLALQEFRRTFDSRDSRRDREGR